MEQGESGPATPTAAEIGQSRTAIHPGLPHPLPTAATPAAPAVRIIRRGTGSSTGHGASQQLALLLCYLAGGVVVTWPLASYLGRRVPDIPDPASYIWSLWWVAHQVMHLANPWSTVQMAAPAGVQLGYDTLMPVLGLAMLPVTALAGPAVSYGVLVTVLPGTACYLTYRAARLWLRPAGAVAAGALYGYSTMLTWQDWYHLNIAAGAAVLPLALEASVRLRRGPGLRQAITLGLVLGLATGVNQESAVLAGLLAGLAVAPWLLAHPSPVRMRAAAVAALTTMAVAAPQLAAMAVQARAGAAAAPATELPYWYRRLGAGPLTLFSPSPRLRSWGLGSLAAGYHYARAEAVPAFGGTLTLLALAGLLISWRRRGARPLALLWLGSAALAMGSAVWAGHRSYLPVPVTRGGVGLSAVLPFTWLVQLPGLSAFREADRFALLGLLPAALLAGSMVDWLVCNAHLTRSSPSAKRAVLAGCLLAAAVAGAAAEAGWPGGGPDSPTGRMVRTSLPALDRPIAADRSRSIVVDVPFGIRGGLPERFGASVYPQALLLGAEDGHPRAVSYTSWIPVPTLIAISRHPFYARLAAAQNGLPVTAQQAAQARLDARRMDVGWVLVWPKRDPWVLRYLSEAGFRLSYRADGVAVYRLSSLPLSPPPQQPPSGSRSG